jgi:hypothetical protein
VSLFASSVDYPLYLVESTFADSAASAFFVSSLDQSFLSSISEESLPGGAPGSALDGTSDDNGMLGAIKSYLEANGALTVTVTLFNRAAPGILAV